MKNISLQIKFLICWFFLNSLAYSQMQNNIWYFGDKAGINFNTGTPVALTDGAMLTSDNTASMAHYKEGYAMFYSNGEKVWNRNHVVMPNGNGLLGHETGGNSAFAVRQPGSDTLYYLFTNDAFGWANGLRYSIIDMSLEGGLGNVTAVKNIPLISPSTEKIEAVLHTNNNDVWIITHPFNSGSFHSYLLTSSGLNTTPVISTVGSIHTGGSTNGNNAIGQIAANPAGNKIALAIYELNKYEIFDFDRSTGVLSNPIVISGYTNSWGVEFSSNGTFLYTTQWGSGNISQFDISSNNQTAIVNSVVTVGVATSTNTLYKSLYIKRGPDDRIYVTRWNSQYLGVIEYPNLAGIQCNYIDNGFHLGGKLSKAGLPAFMSTTLSTFSENISTNEFNVSLYPNPMQFSGIFSFGKEVNNCEIHIFDINGKCVRNEKLKNVTSYTFYRNSLAAGVYTYKIIDNSKNLINGKLIIID